MGLRNHRIFKAGDGSQQLAGLKRLHNVRVGAHAARLLRFERLQLANRKKDRNVRGLFGFFQALANFQPAVTGHVNVENDEIRSGLGDALERGRTVIDRDHVVARVGQDLSPHVLGGHTIIGQQYFARQALSFDTKRKITRSYPVLMYKSIIRKPMSDRE